MKILVAHKILNYGVLSDWSPLRPFGYTIGYPYK